MIQKEIDLAFEKRDVEKNKVFDGITKIRNNFSIGNEVEYDRLISKESLLDNFKLDFFVNNISGNFFINQKVDSSSLPFHNSGTSVHLGRYDDISLEIATLKRNPNILNRFDNVYSIIGRVPNNLKKKYSPPGISNNNSIVVDENFKNTAIELFGERIEKNLTNMYGMLGAEQTNIIKKYNSDNSIWVNGFAGTGKTVIALELFVKGSFGKDSIALFANGDAVVKANKFLSEVNNDQVATTYKNEDLKLSNKVKEFFDILKSIGDFLPFGELLPDVIVKFSNQSFIFKKLPNFLLEFEFNGSEKEKVLILKTIVEKFGPNPKYFLQKNIEAIYHNIKLYKNSIKKIQQNGNIVKDIEGSEFLGNILSKEFKYNFILMDEAPIVMAYPYLSQAIKSLTINNKAKYISAFDEYQYSSSDGNNIWKYIHFDLKGSLNTVYRTTKEIFSSASKDYILPSKWKAPVSISSSVTFGETLEKVIKLSWAVKNYKELIGLEFKELTILEDIDLNLIDGHILYMIRTRAVRKLSFIKGGE